MVDTGKDSRSWRTVSYSNKEEARVPSVPVPLVPVAEESMLRRWSMGDTTVISCPVGVHSFPSGQQVVEGPVVWWQFI